MTYGSLFAGIGGFCLGMERAGMRCAWRVEIEPNCCRVLSRHWPTDHLHKDVRDFHADGTVQRPDVVTFGFPCQDVSVAGRRAGLAGERSGLFYEACRIIGEFSPKVIVCENVPGLLTSNGGRDMGAVVGSLADLGYGIAWRVLDAQWFGLAQRRKRLFIVGVSGADVRRAAQILLEPESVPRDSAPSREEVALAAAGAAGCARKCGACRRPRAARGVSCEDVADPICTREGKTWTCEGRNNFRTRNLVGVPFAKSKRACSASDHETWIEAEVSPTINGFDQGDARATTVAATWWDGGDVSQTLDAVLAKGQTMPEKNRFPAVLVPPPGDGWRRVSFAAECPVGLDGEPLDICSICGGTYSECPCPGPTMDGVEYMERDGVLYGREVPASGEPATLPPSPRGVRRLLPVEAERLQGFPDEWTAVGGDGKALSDSARYRALGNAVAVPVAAWIARRIVASGALGGGSRA